MKKYVVLAVMFIMLAIASASYASDCDLKVAIISDAPVFSYVVGDSYKAEVTITNQGTADMKLDKLSLFIQRDDLSVGVDPQSSAPESIKAGASVVVVFPIIFPSDSANKKVTILSKLDCDINGNKSSEQASTSIVPSSKYEITLLPARSIVDPNTNMQRVGMSIINHSQEPFEGKITLTSSQGLTVTPDTLDAKIEPQGLEAYVFSVNAQKGLAPGHYAVFINVGDKVKDWVAIDIPVLAKKTSGSIAIDGKLDDWKDAASVNIAKLISQDGDKAKYESIGKGEFAYDDANFYMAFEVGASDRVAIVAFDPLINGAKAAGGGYKDDDFEYLLTYRDDDEPVLMRKNFESNMMETNAKLLRRIDSGKSIYEIAVPWSELAPFKPAKDAKFAISVMVGHGSGNFVEWGGGIHGKRDPRMFIPVILTQ